MLPWWALLLCWCPICQSSHCSPVHLRVPDLQVSCWDMTTSMVQCKTAVSPLITHWRYCSLALSHQHDRVPEQYPPQWLPGDMPHWSSSIPMINSWCINPFGWFIGTSKNHVSCNFLPLLSRLVSFRQNRSCAGIVFSHIIIFLRFFIEKLGKKLFGVFFLICMYVLHKIMSILFLFCCLYL